MGEKRVHPAVTRVAADSSNAIALEVLASGFSGADLRSVLLGVFEQRAAVLEPADLMRQYRHDRFVAPAQINALTLARLELTGLEVAAAEGFAPTALAPVAPLGTHAVLGAVPQNNVITTARLSEVTADPTNSLALEAAVRRRGLLADDPRSSQAVNLVATHRVVRAQPFDGPRSFAHFSLLGMVSAGRDQGNYEFELDALHHQLSTMTTIVGSITESAIKIAVTALTSNFGPHCLELCERMASPGVSCTIWPEREQGRNYYRNVCFKIYAKVGGQDLEFGDGGDVWWTQELLANRKERLVIGGLGLERLAMVDI